MRRIRADTLSLAGAGTSQVLASISNVIISMALARGAGAEGLGEFTIAFTAYLIARGFQRSLVAEPFHAVPRGGRVTREEAHVVSASLAYSAICAVFLAAAGLWLGLPYLLVLAAVLPAVNMQDIVRYVAFRRDHPSIASLTDGVWVIASLAVWPVVSEGSASLAVVLWGAGGALGAVVGLWLLQVRPTRLVAAVRWWWVHARYLGTRLALAGAAYTVTDQLAILGIAIFVTDQALGELRAGQILIQPTGILLAALQVFLLPRLADWSRGSLYTKKPLLISVAAATAGSVILGGTLLVLGPLSRLLFGGEVSVVMALAIPLALRAFTSAAAVGFAVALKADQQGNAFVGARLIGGVLGLVAILIGVVMGGIVGAAWGMGIQGLLYCVMLAHAWATVGRMTKARL